MSGALCLRIRVNPSAGSFWDLQTEMADNDQACLCSAHARSRASDEHNPGRFVKVSCGPRSQGSVRAIGREPREAERTKDNDSMKTSIAVTFLVAGLFGPAIIGVHAQPFMPLNVKFTVEAQDYSHEQVGSSEVFKSTTLKMKVTNREILDLLGIAYGSDFTGAKLAVNYQNGHFVVLNTNNTVIVDATAGGYMTGFFADESDSICKGICDHRGGSYSQKYKYVCVKSFTFDDTTNDNEFVFGGVQQEDYRYDGETGAFTSICKLDGAGAGYLETPPGGGEGSSFIIKGTIQGRVSGID
jgi:hypothetical protein